MDIFARLITNFGKFVSRFWWLRLRDFLYNDFCLQGKTRKTYENRIKVQLSRLNLQIFGQPNEQTREIPEENAFDGRQSTGADTYRQATKALDRNVDGCEECLGFPRKWNQWSTSTQQPEKRGKQWYFFTKIVQTYWEKKMFQWLRKNLKFEAESREFTKILRSL